MFLTFSLSNIHRSIVPLTKKRKFIYSIVIRFQSDKKWDFGATQYPHTYIPQFDLSHAAQSSRESDGLHLYAT
jgi:hypothetical protein